MFQMFKRTSSTNVFHKHYYSVTLDTVKNDKYFVGNEANMLPGSDFRRNVSIFFASGFSPLKRILWTKIFRKHNDRTVLFVLTYELILSTNGSVIDFCSCHRQHVATSHRKPKNSVQTISRNSKNCLVQKKWPNALLPWRQNLRTLALVACRCPARPWLTQKLVVLSVKDWNAIE